MSRAGVVAYPRDSGFPRTRGDEPGVLVKYRYEAEFSPHARG